MIRAQTKLNPISTLKISIPLPGFPLFSPIPTGHHAPPSHFSLSARPAALRYPVASFPRALASAQSPRKNHDSAQEISSWTSPIFIAISQPPSIPSPAPSIPEQLAFPRSDGRPTVVTFLRHCGCPFAEKTLLSLRSTAQQYPQISFIAISHSGRAATDHWLEALSGPGSVEVLVDEQREIYARWGLGVSDWWHVLSPSSMWSVWKLGRGEGIWNRPTESGSRWQRAGSWAVDGDGVVKWGGVFIRADEIPDFGQAVLALENVQEKV